SQLRTLPIHSGSDVVGAATMPPVGSYVSGFKVMSERITASRHSPSYVHRADHFFHHLVVSLIARLALNSRGGGTWDSWYARMKGTFSPASTTKSATVLCPAPCVGVGVWRINASGPATAPRPPSDA